MKYFITSVLLLVIGFVLTSAAPNAIPACLQAKIGAILAQPVWNPPARISKYLYRGRIMYLSSSNCCDQFIPLYDESCNQICAPFGGFTGRGDGRCPDFSETAESLGNVWADTRSRGK